MRIGFDGSCLSNRRGFGRFSRLLLESLARRPGKHQLVVVIDRPSEPAVTIPEGCDRVVVDVGDAPSAAASAQGRRRFGDMLAMGRAVARAGLDLMYFPATYTFFPVWNVPRLVVTMHDTLALAHPELVFPTRRGRLAWLLKEHAAARMADRIVTVSETSRRDLQAWFRLPADRLRVITEGPDPIFRPEAGVLGQRQSCGNSRFLRRQVSALRWRTEPTQEPASPDRGVFADQGHELAAGRGWRLQGRLPHPRRGDPVGHRLGRPERSGAPARLRA